MTTKIPPLRPVTDDLATYMSQMYIEVKPLPHSIVKGDRCDVVLKVEGRELFVAEDKRPDWANEVSDRLGKMLARIARECNGQV